MGWTQLPPIPPSEGQDGKLHTLRFLAQAEPGRPAQKGFGSLFAMVVLGFVVLVVIGAAVFLGLQAEANVHVTVSNVTAQVGSCMAYPEVGGGTQSVTYSFLLTNSGSRDAIAILNLYANGAYLGPTEGITVPAGHTIPVHESAWMDACGPVTPTVTLNYVSPVA